MSDGSTLPLQAGDVVAIHLTPGEAWGRLVAEIWADGAALFPIDNRLPSHAVQNLLERAQPTVVIDATGRRRVRGGHPGSTDLGLVIATSGSRSGPRLVELSRAAVGAAVEASLLALGARSADTWTSCLPLSHVGGLLVVLRGVLSGCPLRFRQASDLRPPPEGGFTSIVPTMLERALDSGTDLSGYGAILVGGSGLPAALAGRAQRAGARCISTYGLTQSCGGVVYDGRALPGVGVRISEEGEIELAGPTLLSGYRGGDIDGGITHDGWLRTGDAGRLDADGRLEVIGRLDDTIVTGGEKVWPPAVEAVLREHPEVADVAVIGRPDPTWGHRVVAVIVPRSASSPPALADLRQRVGLALGRHHAPRELVLVDRLPRSALGKVLLGELGGGARSGEVMPLGDDERR